MVNTKKGGGKKGGGKNPPTAPMTPVNTTSDSSPNGEKSTDDKSQTNDSVSQGAIVRLTRALVWWTGTLAVATAGLGIAAVLQWRALVSTDHNVAKQADIAHDALVASNRAWVGPFNAKLSAEPVLDQSLDVIIQYMNTGREPALRLDTRIEPFIATVADDMSGTTRLKIEKAAVSCIENMPLSGKVAYPSLGGASYEQKKTIPKEKIIQNVVDGDGLIIVLGCFSYVTMGEVRHSAFCYYYQANKIKIDHLGICISGQRAD